MESLLLQQIDRVGATNSRVVGGLAEQLGGGGAMDLGAFDLKRGLVDHEVASGLALALLTEQGKRERRAVDMLSA